MEPTYLSVGVIDDLSRKLLSKIDFGKFNEQIQKAINKHKNKNKNKNVNNKDTNNN
mgnify:CR=1 FL=1